MNINKILQTKCTAMLPLLLSGMIGGVLSLLMLSEDWLLCWRLLEPKLIHELLHVHARMMPRDNFGIGFILLGEFSLVFCKFG